MFYGIYVFAGKRAKIIRSENERKEQKRKGTRKISTIGKDKKENEMGKAVICNISVSDYSRFINDLRNIYYGNSRSTIFLLGRTYYLSVRTTDSQSV